MQFRLYGGESEIRTFSTFLSAAKNRRVRNIQRILQHTRPIRRIALNTQIGRVVPFRVPPKGERPAIVRLKIASFGMLLPQFGSQMTACVPPSPKRKISPQSVVAKRQVNEDFWRLLQARFSAQRLPGTVDD